MDNNTTTEPMNIRPALIGVPTETLRALPQIGTETSSSVLDGQVDARVESSIIELNPGIFVESGRMHFDRLAPLSARELDIVQQLVDGHSTDEGAQALYISRHTFRTHVKNILRKLDLHSSLELASVAVECGMRPSRLSA